MKATFFLVALTLIFYSASKAQSNFDNNSGSLSANSCGPIPAICVPPIDTLCCGLGVVDVYLNTLAFNRNNSLLNYIDQTCTDSTVVIAGVPYYMNVNTGFTYQEDLSCWIDYNNDGDFSSGELLFSDFGLTNHNNWITIPSGVTYQMPLRMRVCSDYQNFSMGPCPTTISHSTIDFTIYCLAPISVAEISNPININVYPNPAEDFIRLNLPTNEKINSIELIDLIGKKTEAQFDGEQIDVNKLYSGIYTVQIHTGNHFYVSTFIKQ